MSYRLIGVCVAFLSLFILAMCRSEARDLGQWENLDPQIKRWFESLKQPDNPSISCCGEADAYWADIAETDNGQLVAVVTDDRPDEPLRRPHVPVGTRIVIPQSKIKWDQGNPTGHIVLFLSARRDVYCYVQNGGV